MERARTTLGQAWHSEDVHGGQEGSQFCQADRGITEVVCEVLVLYVVLWSLRATNSYNSLVRHAYVHCCSIDNRSAFFSSAASIRWRDDGETELVLLRENGRALALVFQKSKGSCCFSSLAGLVSPPPCLSLRSATDEKGHATTLPWYGEE